MTDEILATILLQAYKESIADKCRLRYIDAGGNIIVGHKIYHIRQQSIIACVHGIHE